MILLRISSRWNFALRPSVFYNFERLQPGMAASVTETWSTVTSARAKNEIAFPIYLLERQFITKEAALVTPVKESEIYLWLFNSGGPPKRLEASTADF